MAANNYLDINFIEETVYFLLKDRKIVFPRGNKRHWFFNKKCIWLIVGEKYTCESYASTITANFTLKRFFMVKNPFLYFVGGAEKGFKALFTFAVFVDEKR